MAEHKHGMLEITTSFSHGLSDSLKYILLAGNPPPLNLSPSTIGPRDLASHHAVGGQEGTTPRSHGVSSAGAGGPSNLPGADVRQGE